MKPSAILAVLTSPRPRGVNYLSDTLAALDREPWPGPHVIVYDGNFPKPPKEWTGFGWGQRQGNVAATWRIFEWCTRWYPGLDLLLLEDDVRPCKNALTAAAALEVPEDLPFVSLFHGKIHDVPPGLSRNGFARFNFSQAIKWSAAAVVKMLEFGQPKGDPATGNGKDSVMKQVCPHAWRYWGLVTPSWFEHVGDSSLVVPARRHKIRSAMWAGYEHDALAALEALDSSTQLPMLVGVGDSLHDKIAEFQEGKALDGARRDLRLALPKGARRARIIVRCGECDRRWERKIHMGDRKVSEAFEELVKNGKLHEALYNHKPIHMHVEPLF